MESAAFFEIDERAGRLTARTPGSARDWSEAFAVIAKRGIVKLSAPALTDEAARRLTRLPHLQELDCGGATSPLTDRAFEALRHLPNLRRFAACWTPGLSDRGAAHLAGCPLLEDVDLLGTAAGDGAIQALTGRPHLHRFRTGRAVTDAGLKLLAQFPVFKTWRGGEENYELMSPEAQPNHLTIDGPFTDAGLANLAQLEGLFALTIFRHAHAFTAAGLEALLRLPHLGFLGCQEDRCDDAAMRRIAALPHLRMLMSQGAVASDAGFKTFSRSQTVEYLWGRLCPNLHSAGFAALAEMPALRGLAVSLRNVGEKALSLLPRFPALRELMPMDMTDDGFRHVGALENLEDLWCMYCPETGDAATEHLAGLTRLQSYYAGKTKITDRSLDILARLPSLERLEFWHCPGITQQGMARLAALPRLKEIRLDGCAVYPA